MRMYFVNLRDGPISDGEFFEFFGTQDVSPYLMLLLNQAALRHPNERVFFGELKIFFRQLSESLKVDIVGPQSETLINILRPFSAIANYKPPTKSEFSSYRKALKNIISALDQLDNFYDSDVFHLSAELTPRGIDWNRRLMNSKKEITESFARQIRKIDSYSPLFKSGVNPAHNTRDRLLDLEIAIEPLMKEKNLRPVIEPLGSFEKNPKRAKASVRKIITNGCQLYRLSLTEKTIREHISEAKKKRS